MKQKQNHCVKKTGLLQTNPWGNFYGKYKCTHCNQFDGIYYRVDSDVAHVLI